MQGIDIVTDMAMTIRERRIDIDEPQPATDRVIGIPQQKAEGRIEKTICFREVKCDGITIAADRGNTIIGKFIN